MGNPKDLTGMCAKHLQDVKQKRVRSSDLCVCVNVYGESVDIIWVGIFMVSYQFMAIGALEMGEMATNMPEGGLCSGMAKAGPSTPHGLVGKDG